eukprot:TRINITY_DN797_c0_g1_i6.p1 TRINITY_DN797_c0_g1~~TRINITY_DN797_c0_g1_i6.p1  ORF type:complete len:116 (-),score=13.27 TRINITY_DN797_c0_g1_i6:91-438(-)
MNLLHKDAASSPRSEQAVTCNQPVRICREMNSSLGSSTSSDGERGNGAGEGREGWRGGAGKEIRYFFLILFIDGTVSSTVRPHLPLHRTHLLPQRWRPGIAGTQIPSRSCWIRPQ